MYSNIEMVLKVAFNLLLCALYNDIAWTVLLRETTQTVHVLHCDLFFVECSFVMQFTSNTMHIAKQVENLKV